MIYPDVQMADIKTFTDWGLKLESINISFPEAKIGRAHV